MFSCGVSSCECQTYSPGSPSVRRCSSCDHGWVHHAVTQISKRVGTEPVSTKAVFDVASLILFGAQAIPIHLKILLDRLLAVLPPNEVSQIFQVFGWSWLDYNRGYVLKDRGGQLTNTWEQCSKDEEPLIMRQFSRFLETRDTVPSIADQNSFPKKTDPETTKPKMPDVSPTLNHTILTSNSIESFQKFIAKAANNSALWSSHKNFSATRPVSLFQTNSQNKRFLNLPGKQETSRFSPMSDRLSDCGTSVSTSHAGFESISNPVSPIFYDGDVSKVQSPFTGWRAHSMDGSQSGEPAEQFDTDSDPDEEDQPQDLSMKSNQSKSSNSDLTDDMPNLSSTKIEPNLLSPVPHKPLFLENEPTEDNLNVNSKKQKKKMTKHFYSSDEIKRLAGKRRVSCGKCVKTFCDKGALKIHNSAVHLKEMHQCTVPGCSMLFSSRRSRNRHSVNKRLHTSTPRKSFLPPPGCRVVSPPAAAEAFQRALLTCYDETSAANESLMVPSSPQPAHQSAVQKSGSSRRKPTQPTKLKIGLCKDEKIEMLENEDDLDDIQGSLHIADDEGIGMDDEEIQANYVGDRIAERQPLDFSRHGTKLVSATPSNSPIGQLENLTEKVIWDGASDCKLSIPLSLKTEPNFRFRSASSASSKTSENDKPLYDAASTLSASADEHEDRLMPLDATGMNITITQYKAQNNVMVDIPICEDNPKLCVYCRKVFNNHFSVKTHIQNVHLKIMHKCTVDGCKTSFPSKRSRDRHSQNAKLHEKLLSGATQHCALQQFDCKPPVSRKKSPKTTTDPLSPSPVSMATTFPPSPINQIPMEFLQHQQLLLSRLCQQSPMIPVTPGFGLVSQMQQQMNSLFAANLAAAYQKNRSQSTPGEDKECEKFVN